MSARSKNVPDYYQHFQVCIWHEEKYKISFQSFSRYHIIYETDFWNILFNPIPQPKENTKFKISSLTLLVSCTVLPLGCLSFTWLSLVFSLVITSRLSIWIPVSIVSPTLSQRSCKLELSVFFACLAEKGFSSFL